MSKTIAFFSIPAHGHINPMLPVAKELVESGNNVQFYSFDTFEEKISKTGAQFVSCDRFLPKLSKQKVKKLKNVSSSEMIIEDLRITQEIDTFLTRQFTSIKPEAIYADSVCFWGKLIAEKLKIPLIVSTSTFAFNEYSSKYLKPDFKERIDLILNIPRINRELEKLNKLGYCIDDFFDLIKNDSKTNSVVYTTRDFQPYGNTFSNHYAFIGPSIFAQDRPAQKQKRPLIYISMGTVLEKEKSFYRSCIEALRNLKIDVVISGFKASRKLPENIHAFPFVNQLDLLSKASAFITHCGMNSVSESLFMKTPMLLYPQTSEECAIARRVVEKGAGINLKNHLSRNIRKSVIEILENPNYKTKAEIIGNSFQEAPGPKGAAEFILNATSDN